MAGRGRGSPSSHVRPPVSQMPTESARQISITPNRDYAVGLARAAAGAVIFAIPMFMTMEMWELGSAMSRGRLAILLALTVPMLVGLSWISGFEETETVLDDVVDAFVAIAIGAAVSAIVLTLVGALRFERTLPTTLGQIALQTVPASIGALLAESTFGAAREEREREQRGDSYLGELLMMLVGALFLALNIAPTEEVILIAYRLAPWQTVMLALVSLLVTHLFVLAVAHRERKTGEGDMRGQLLLRFTVVGYAIVLLVCGYVLWSFGRFDDVSMQQAIAPVLVLAFPAAIGASAARLIL